MCQLFLRNRHLRHSHARKAAYSEYPPCSIFFLSLLSNPIKSPTSNPSDRQRLQRNYFSFLIRSSIFLVRSSLRFPTDGCLVLASLRQYPNNLQGPDGRIRTHVTDYRDISGSGYVCTSSPGGRVVSRHLYGRSRNFLSNSIPELPNSINFGREV